MKLKVLTIATVSVCLITATVIAVGNSKVAFLGDQIVKANGEDITFYATSEAFYNGTPYSETMYFVRIVDPVYDYLEWINHREFDRIQNRISAGL